MPTSTGSAALAFALAAWLQSPSREREEARRALIHHAARLGGDPDPINDALAELVGGADLDATAERLHRVLAALETDALEEVH